MTRLFLIAVLMTCAAPALAQDEADGRSMMERGAKMLMEGLMREIEPALEDLQGLAKEFGPSLGDFTTQMGPALRNLLRQVEDWSLYAPPEMLENGDIIIRRKQPPADTPEPDTDGQIDL